MLLKYLFMYNIKYKKTNLYVILLPNFTRTLKTLGEV